MDTEPFALARIAQHSAKGKVLLATSALHAGQTVLHEPALLLVPHDASMHDIYRAFMDAPPAVQTQVLQFWAPVDGPKAEGFRQAAIAEKFRGDVETLVKLFMVVALNAAAVCPEGGGAQQHSIGIFQTAGRASHSCSPNCCWFSDAQSWMVFRTLVPIEQGQELTVDYKAKRFIFQTVCRRQDELLAKREFLCDCPRCTAYGDDMRVFPCTSPGCCGHTLVHQPSSQHSPEFTPCSACGSLPSPAAAARQLAQEAELHSQLDSIEAAVAAKDTTLNVMPMLMRLQPPHPRHAAAGRIAQQRYTFFAASRQWERAAAALEAAVEFESAAVPSSPETSHEDLGDAILKVPRLTAQHIRRAEQAFRKAMQVFMIARGPSASGPHFEELSSKLLATQARLPAAAVAALRSLDACSFCGGGRGDGGPLARCGRCHAAAYCCREHQRAQWPLHKQHCKPPAS